MYPTSILETLAPTSGVSFSPRRLLLTPPANSLSPCASPQHSRLICRRKPQLLQALSSASLRQPGPGTPGQHKPSPWPHSSIFREILCLPFPVFFYLKGREIWKGISTSWLIHLMPTNSPWLGHDEAKSLEHLTHVVGRNLNLDGSSSEASQAPWQAAGDGGGARTLTQAL